MAALIIAKVFVDPVTDTNFPGDKAKFAQFGYSSLAITFAVVFFLYCILAFKAVRQSGQESKATRSLLFMFFVSFIILAALLTEVAMDMFQAFNFGSFVLDDRFFAQLIPGEKERRVVFFVLTIERFDHSELAFGSVLLVVLPGTWNV